MRTKPASKNLTKCSRLSLLAIICGLCIATVFLGFKYIGQKTDFEDAATFGADTSTVMTSINGHLIHCSDSRDAEKCITDAKKRRVVNSVLWLGNSQVHAVNQLQTGESNSTPLLFERLKDVKLDLVTFSQPNANLQEHLVLFKYLKQQLPVKVLILPIVFDDMREEGLRKEVSDFLNDASVNKALTKSSIGLKILTANKALLLTDKDDTAGISHTLQEKVERALNIWLADISILWAARPEIRGQLMHNLYILRNMMLGIKPTSKRKIIRNRYQDNFEALEAILASANDAKITVLLYIVPLRSDIEVPYVASEYFQFKTDVASLAKTYHTAFFNLENLVPAELWGTKGSTSGGVSQELDFMHFQAGGHKLLADQLAELVTSVWAAQGIKQ
jgi:hypothetical protein